MFPVYPMYRFDCFRKKFIFLKRKPSIPISYGGGVGISMRERICNCCKRKIKPGVKHLAVEKSGRRDTLYSYICNECIRQVLSLL